MCTDVILCFGACIETWKFHVLNLSTSDVLKTNLDCFRRFNSLNSSVIRSSRMRLPTIK